MNGKHAGTTHSHRPGRQAVSSTQPHHKIKAIKAIRWVYGTGEGHGLKEVKALVETVSFGARFAAGQPLPQSKAVELYLQLQAAGFDPVLRAQD